MDSQGPISRIPGLDPLWLLNHYQFQDHENQNGPGQAIIFFSRSAGPGSNRFPVGFSDDNIVTWNSLKFQPEFAAIASNIGYMVEPRLWPLATWAVRETTKWQLGGCNLGFFSESLPFSGSIPRTADGHPRNRGIMEETIATS